jgi:hypothetical protein
LIQKILFLQLDERIRGQNLIFSEPGTFSLKFLVVVWKAVFGAWATHRGPKLKPVQSETGLLKLLKPVQSKTGLLKHGPIMGGERRRVVLGEFRRRWKVGHENPWEPEGNWDG